LALPAQAAVSGERWCLRRAGALHIKTWDEDESVVYDAVSGDTRLADALALVILQELERTTGCAVDQLVRRLRDECEVQSDGEIAARIEQCLHGLNRIGLVSR
jgi:PqqD family protein of HPr-rel-A system